MSNLKWKEWRVLGQDGRPYRNAFQTRAGAKLDLWYVRGRVIRVEVRELPCKPSKRRKR